MSRLQTKCRRVNDSPVAAQYRCLGALPPPFVGIIVMRFCLYCLSVAESILHTESNYSLC